MAFVPTQKQIDSLYLLLTQLRRENVRVRLIRFINWAENIEGQEIEVICLEDKDRYKIFYDGRIT